MYTSRLRATTSAAVTSAKRSSSIAMPGIVCEVGLGDAVELGGELDRAAGRRAERIDLHGEVAVVADRLHERRGRGDLAQVGDVDVADDRRGRRAVAAVAGGSRPNSDSAVRKYWRQLSSTLAGS